jgi:hypothetical protein
VEWGEPTETQVSNDEPGYVLRISDRTAAAMQLAAHFTSEAMNVSQTDDPRARLAEQLGFFDLAFRSIMGSTARAMIKSGSASGTDPDLGSRARFSLDFAGNDNR